MKIKRKPIRCELPLASIGDIVFNLLIFFVILAKAQDDSNLRWNPARTPEVENVGNSKVSVLIDDHQRVHLNGQEISVGQLESAISTMLGDSPAENRRVLLKVHDETASQKFEPVIEAISKAGGDLWLVLEKEQGKR